MSAYHLTKSRILAGLGDDPRVARFRLLSETGPAARASSPALAISVDELRSSAAI